MHANNTIEAASDAGAVLIDATEAGCRMCAEWLVRAADLEAIWVDALEAEEFRDLVADLCGLGEPNFDAAALQLLADIKSRCDIMVLRFDLDNLGDWTFADALLRIEFAAMVRLGFFRLANRRYEMVVPEPMTAMRIKQAALDLLATKIEHEMDGVEAVRPEALLTTMSASDAEAERSKFMAIRGFEEDYRRGSMQ